MEFLKGGLSLTDLLSYGAGYRLLLKSWGTLLKVYVNLKQRRSSEVRETPVNWFNSPTLQKGRNTALKGKSIKSKECPESFEKCLT